MEWTKGRLNVTLAILLVGLIVLAYFAQSPVDHPCLSTVKLLGAHQVLLTATEDLLEDDDEIRSMLLRLPPKVNLWDRAGSSKIPVDDQGVYGSCTAHAMRYAWNLWRMRLNPNSNLIVPSRCFWYAQSRMRLGDPPPLDDLGSTNEATVWALVNKGQIAESAYPYTMQNMTREPPPATLSGGATGRSNIAVKFLFRSNRDQNVIAMKTALSQGKSIIVAIMVYSSFMTSAVMRTGKVPLPNVSRERLMGGHAVTITGYDDAKQTFSFRNSWGTSVGVKGLFQIPYLYLGNPNITGDAWII